MLKEMCRDCIAYDKSCAKCKTYNLPISYVVKCALHPDYEDANAKLLGGKYNMGLNSKDVQVIPQQKATKKEKPVVNAFTINNALSDSEVRKDVKKPTKADSQKKKASGTGKRGRPKGSTNAKSSKKDVSLVINEVATTKAPDKIITGEVASKVNGTVTKEKRPYNRKLNPDGTPISKGKADKKKNNASKVLLPFKEWVTERIVMLLEQVAEESRSGKPLNEGLLKEADSLREMLKSNNG